MEKTVKIKNIHPHKQSHNHKHTIKLYHLTNKTQNVRKPNFVNKLYSKPIEHKSSLKAWTNTYVRAFKCPKVHITTHVMNTCTLFNFSQISEDI